MTPCCISAFGLCLLLTGLAHGEVDIKVEAKDPKAVNGVRVFIEEVTNAADIDQGRTDTNGKWTTKKLPGNYKTVRIRIIPDDPAYATESQVIIPKEGQEIKFTLRRLAQ